MASHPDADFIAFLSVLAGEYAEAHGSENDADTPVGGVPATSR